MLETRRDEARARDRQGGAVSSFVSGRGLSFRRGRGKGCRWAVLRGTVSAPPCDAVVARFHRDAALPMAGTSCSCAGSLTPHRGFDTVNGPVFTVAHRARAYLVFWRRSSRRVVVVVVVFVIVLVIVVSRSRMSHRVTCAMKRVWRASLFRPVEKRSTSSRSILALSMLQGHHTVVILECRCAD